MAEFKHLASFDSQGRPNLVTIAAGPVIIQNGKVLLDKHGDDFWKFPGGAVESENSFEENARREVKEELGLEVELKGEPYIISFTREKDGKDELVILIHYLADIISGEPTVGRDVAEFAWQDIDNLPADCAPNIRLAVEYFRTLKH